MLGKQRIIYVKVVRWKNITGDINGKSQAIFELLEYIDNKPTVCTALTMSAISAICSYKLATFTVCEFTYSRSLCLPTLPLYNIFIDVSS
jgi:hypothetical protein